MTKKEAISLLKTLRKALSGMDGEFLERILADNPMKDITDEPIKYRQGLPASPIEYHIKVCLPKNEAFVFKVLFNSHVRDSYVEPECEYITSRGIGRTTSVEDKTVTPPYFQTYGKGKYSYSFSDLDTKFECEPFYMNHLTGKDLQWFSDTVRKSMEEWDEWLAAGTVSKDNYDRQLSKKEKATMYLIAPYMDELHDIDDVLNLFKKK